MRSTFLGLIAAVVILYYSVTQSLENQVLLFNLSGIIIVIGGTISAGIITFGIPGMFGILKNTLRVFSRSKIQRSRIMKELMEVNNRLETRPRVSGLTKDFAHVHPFLLDGLRLIENDISKEKIQEILELDLDQRQTDHLHQVEILKTLAKYPPAFGMIGTVIGLIGLMSTMGKDSSEIGPLMAIALLTTLYGLLAANYFFTPMSDNLLHRLAADTSARQMIIHGVLMLKDKTDPVILKETLLVHLAPGDRKDFFERGAMLS